MVLFFFDAFLPSTQHTRRIFLFVVCASEPKPSFAEDRMRGMMGRASAVIPKRAYLCAVRVGGAGAGGENLAQTDDTLCPI